MTKTLNSRLDRLEQAKRAPQQPITGFRMLTHGETPQGVPLPGGWFHLAPVAAA